MKLKIENKKTKRIYTDPAQQRQSLKLRYLTSMIRILMLFVT